MWYGAFFLFCLRFTRSPAGIPAMNTPIFRSVADRIREHARAASERPALIQDDTVLRYGDLDALMDRIAAALQRDGLSPGEAIAMCGHSTPRQAALFLGALRAGVAAAPLAPSVTADSFASMLKDSQARCLFVDASAAALVPPDALPHCVALDAGAPGQAFEDWLAPAGAQPHPVQVDPAAPFNIIYSSGTTGTPKGIVQPHGMRAAHIERGARYGYGPQTVTLLATPLYSNTTLVVFFPTIAHGGSVLLMHKFDAAAYLSLAEGHSFRAYVPWSAGW
jgi:acyl-CoA synthetase (AMP-forming)/AMP-acid ligase II